MALRRTLSLLLAMGLCAGSGSAEAQPRVGLALSGGGARGLAHVGVLKALEELEIPVHAIAGTSMGAIIGALYASGRRPDEINRFLTEIQWNELLVGDRKWAQRRLQDKRESRDYFLGLEFGLGGERAVAPAGVLAGQKLDLLLRRVFDTGQGFAGLKIPFRTVATDVNAAQPYVMAEGDLVSALRATMAIPLAFEPVQRDGRLLVDGGILNNLPVDVAREMDVDVVIAVDISSPLGQVGSSSSLFSVAYQSIDSALIQNTIRSLATADLVIAPDLGELTSADFNKAREFAELGYQAAMTRARFLEAVATDSASYTAWRTELRADDPLSP